MNAAQFQIQLIAVLAASSCALLGVFLVLRRMVMMSDAISHTVLLGIVLGFFMTGDLASPYLVIVRQRRPRTPARHRRRRGRP